MMNGAYNVRVLKILVAYDIISLYDYGETKIFLK